MAKVISNEQMKLEVIIDGNEAQKELTKLDKTTRELRESNKALLVEKQKLEKQGKKETEAYKTVTATIRENNRVINENRNRTKQLQEQIGITALTMTQLRSRATQLRIQLNNTIPGTADYIRYQNDLKQVSARMDELRGKAKATQMTIGTVADSFNRYTALGASAIATLTGLAISVQKIIDYNGKLSDSQADVMKTTGMTKAEVDELTRSFGLLNTRTQRIDLLKIAEEGGRIGIVGSEIEEFVRVMDIANVALGDSFTGGVEEVASKLGKLKMLFTETKDLGVEDAYMRIGSAINDLGANGVATERNITEFTTRIGALPDQLKPTIAETLALGAAFEESGIEAEVSARAYSIFLNRASTETASFARVMGLPVQKVKEMINDNPLEFFLQFAEKLKGINPEATEMAQILDELKINADGANKVIGAASNNTQRFRDTIELSNASMIEGTSLLNEFDVKNNNLAATLQKVKQRIASWFSSETMASWLENLINLFAKLIGVTETSSVVINGARFAFLNFFKVLVIITAGWFSYNVAIILTTKSIRDFTLAQKLLTAIQARWTIVANTAKALYLWFTVQYNLLTKNTLRAAAAQKILNTTMSANPLGVVLFALTAVITALAVYKNKTDDATKAQHVLNNVNKQANEAIASQKTEIELLLRIARDETREKAERLKAIERLNEISPLYLSKLNLETINTNEATTATNEYTKSLYANARAQAALAKINELEAEKLEIEETSSKDYRGTVQKGSDALWSMLGVETQYYKSKEEIEKYVKENFAKQIKLKESGTYDEKIFRNLVDGIYVGSGLDQKEAKLASIEARQTILKDKILNSENAVENITSETTQNRGYTPGGATKSSSDTEANKQQREHEQRLNEIKRHYDEQLKLERAFEDGNYELMEEGYAKEKQILETQHQRKIEDLRAKLISEEEIEKAQNQSKNEKLTEAQRQSYADLAQAWLDNNAEIYRKIEQETDLHLLRQQKLIGKHSENDISNIEADYAREKIIRQTQLNEQLLALGDNEKAKQALRDEHAKIELEKEIEKVERLMAIYKEMIAGVNVEGLDFSLLPDEVVADFEAKVLKMEEFLSGLKIEKADNDQQEEQNGDSKVNLGGKTDILGFSEEEWQQLFSNLEKGEFGINSWTGALMAVGEAWNTFAPLVDDLMKAQEDRQLKRHNEQADKKERRLKQQLNNGLISQEQYNKAIEAVERDLDRKKLEIEIKQAKRKKKMDIISVIMNTATGIMKGFADLGPIGGAISAILIGTMGALQAATIAKQPLPSISGYEQGLYGDHLVRREQDGKVFKTTYGGKTKSGVVNKNTMYMVGENGPEMVIDNKAFRKMNPQLRESLIRELRGIKGFENGYYNPQSMKITMPEAGDLSNGELIAAIIQLSTVLTRLEQNGLSATVSNKDLRSMKNLKDGIRDFENFRNRNKVS